MYRKCPVDWSKTTVAVEFTSSKYSMTSHPRPDIPSKVRGKYMSAYSKQRLPYGLSGVGVNMLLRAARRRHVLLRFPNRRSLRVQLDRAARQLVRAVRGAVHVLPGRGKLVPGRIIMSKYKSILGVVIMPHRIVQKHVDEIGRHRTDIRVVERRKDITQVPRVLAENENNRLCDLFEMLGDIVR